MFPIRPIDASLYTVEELMQFVNKMPSGCWNWTKCSEGDYGQFYVKGKPSVRAHRLSYTLLRGPIPDGLVIDHLCKNKSCVNPDHLEPVTPSENSRRGGASRNRRYPTHPPIVPILMHEDQAIALMNNGQLPVGEELKMRRIALRAAMNAASLPYFTFLGPRDVRYKVSDIDRLIELATVIAA